MVISQADLVLRAIQLKHEKLYNRAVCPTALQVVKSGFEDCPDMMQIQWRSPEMRPFIVRASKEMGYG